MFEAYRKLALSFGAELPPGYESRDSSSAPPQSHRDALERAARERDVSLETSRVRVGFSRGHLLEIVVQIPWDVAGAEDCLQDAAEIYLEARLGPELLDEWVGSVSVDRIARTRGLVMVADSRRGDAPSHPLEEAGLLVETGVRGIRAELPARLLDRNRGDDWTALEIPEVDSGLQRDRRFASTRFPEALKCALEGMPFSSSRFTRGGEKFCWMSWRAEMAAERRLLLRERVEALVQREGDGWCCLAGTGFGRQRDYIDLWVEPGKEELPLLLRGVSQLAGSLEFGVYDTPLSDFPLQIVV